MPCPFTTDPLPGRLRFPARVSAPGRDLGTHSQSGPSADPDHDTSAASAMVARTSLEPPAASRCRPSPGNVRGRAPEVVLLIAAIAFPLVAGKVQMSVGRQV